MDNSVITYDEIIDTEVKRTTKKQKQFQQILMKKAARKAQTFYILLAFLLTTIVLLRAVSVYCYLIKYRAKKKTPVGISCHK